MSRAHDRARRHRTPSFYERALEAGDRELLEEALEVQGADQEVALLRVHVLKLLEAQSEDPRALQAGLRLLVHALVARHRLSGGEADNLTDTVASLFEHLSAMVTPVGEDLRA